ncbi:unnamed protein product [Angiostrongylus costaricensis]|uniref:ZP domain-containing protein n=1 Tax=Angiostrongylus costaricensis TaxID=334426 RepID=A0A0R3PZB2_ANGCS|nr:unnamed protein product [Angiostrongylus costaricensis]
MLFPILLLSTIVIPTACVPFGKDKGVVLFSCPPEGACYASPRNCLDNCNAAFSIRSYDNDTVTFDIAMMSPLSYTAVLFKNQESGKFETAFICSFHSRYGIVARVNDPPRPVFLMDFIHTTEPEGRTDSIHTRCSTTIFMAPLPADGEYRMTAGHWTNTLVIDEDLAIDVAPAVKNARILSTNERVTIPSRKVPVFRASETEGVNDMMTSESFTQRRQFEDRMWQEKGVRYTEDCLGERGHGDSIGVFLSFIRKIVVWIILF